MKTFFILFLFLLSEISANAQFSVTLVMSPNPSPYLSDWQTRQETARFIVRNNSAQPAVVKISTKIYGSGGTTLLVETQANKMQPITIPPLQTLTLFAEDALPLSAVKFYGTASEVTVRTGKIPADNYKICVGLTDITGNQLFTDPSCGNFRIESYQPPRLLSLCATESQQPITLAQANNLTLQWTGISPPYTAGPIFCHLTICEVLPGQTPLQALIANQPIISQIVLSTQLTITPDMGTFQAGKTYAWGVQSTDQMDRPIGEPDGRSNICTFTIQTSEVTQCPCVPCFVRILQSGGGTLVGAATVANVGTEYTFTAEVETSCPNGCLAKISRGTWTVTFTASDGKTTSVTGGGGSIKFTPPSNGKIHVELTGFSVYCGNSPPCNCNNATLDVTVSGGGGTISDGGGSTTDGGGGGTTTTGDPTHSTTTTLCPCGPCKTNGITMNGNLWADKSIITEWGCKGGEYDFVLDVSPNCIKPCPPTLTAVWQMEFFDEDGKSLGGSSANGTRTSYKVPAEQQGKLVVTFSDIKLKCGNSGECLCPSITVTVVFGCSLFPPPDTTTDKKCKAPVIIPEVATPISLGVRLDSPETFPYPRALPIRAIGYDWDWATILCKYCDGDENSVLRKPVRDMVSKYNWVLGGPGSLNSPADIKELEKIANQIDSIAAQIAIKKAKIDSLEAEKEKIPKRLKLRQDRAKQQIEDIDNVISTLDKTTASLKDSLKKITEQKRSDALKRDDLQKQINTLNAEISKDTTSINQLKIKAENKPQPNELALLAKVDAQRKTVEKAEAELTKREEEVLTESKKLEKDVAASLEAMKTASDEYQRRKAELDKANKTLIRSVATIAANPVYGVYFSRLKDWTNKYNTLINEFLPEYRSELSVLETDVLTIADSIASLGLPLKKRLELSDKFALKLKALMDNAKGKCALKATPALKKGCTDALAIVQLAADKLIPAVAAVAREILKPSVIITWKIDKKKVELLEAQAKKAEDDAKAKAKSYDAAVAGFARSIEALEDKRRTAKDKLDAENEMLGTLSREYANMAAARENDYQINREKYLDQLHELQVNVITKRENLIALTESHNSEIQRIILLEGSIQGLERQITQAAKDKEDLTKSKEELKKILAETPDAALKAVQSEIDKLKTELATLEDALKLLKDNQAKAGTPKKIAVGEVVYYCPPPLEEVLKNKPKFEALKDSVRVAELQFEVAKATKAASQTRLLAELERIAAAMMKFKTASDNIPALEKKYNAAQTKQTANAVAKKLDNSEKEKALADAAAKAQKKQSTAEDKQKQATDDATKQKKELTDAKKEKKDLDNSADKKRMEYLQSMFERQKQEKKVADAEKELKSSAESIKKAQELLKAMNKDSVRLNARREQAEFDKNQALSAKLLTELTTIKDNIAAQNAKIAELNADQKIRSEKHKTEVEELAKALKEEAEKAFDLNETNKDRKTAEQKVNSLNEKLGATLDKSGDAKNAASRAKQRADELAQKLDTLKNEPIDNEKYNKLKDEATTAKEELDKAKKDKDDAEKSVNDALASKKKIENDAKEQFTKAKDKLATAKSDLHNFLVMELNTVKFDAELTITADDDVIDGYRANDKPVTISQKITYPASRIPIFPEIPANDGLGMERGGKECLPNAIFYPNGGIAEGTASIAMPEPRTIALIYKKGEPLWKEWPVIPPDAPLILAKDVPVMESGGNDADIIQYYCGGGSGGCVPSPPLRGAIADIVHLLWDGARYINGANFNYVLPEMPLIGMPKCSDKIELGITYTANEIAADDPKNGKTKPEINAGVLVEVPDSIKGSPKEFATLSPRIITGDHKGLDGETIEFSAKLINGNATKYGFIEANQTMVAGDDPEAKPEFSMKTKNAGYAEALFYYGEGVGEFEITIRWKREKSCKEKKFKAKTPLHLQFLRLAGTAPEPAWKAALAIWDGTATPSTASMPSTSDEKAAKQYKTPPADAVAGLLDENRDGVNGVSIEFKKTAGKIIIKPASDSTKLFGIARTTVDSVPKKEGEEAKLSAKCADAKIRELCEPKEVEGSFKVSKIKLFKIGFPELPFVVELDDDATCGQPITGKGKIKPDLSGVKSEFFKSYLDVGVEVDVKDVEFEGCAGGGEIPIAQSGTATWIGKIQKSFRGFDFTITSLGVTAQRTGLLGGYFTHKTAVPDSVIFEASVKGDGNFICSVSNLPEVSLKGFKLKKGAAVVLDMDADANPDNAKVPADFQGVIIGAATIEFPEALSKSDELRTTLSVKDFSIGTGGVSGEASLTSELRMGIGGYSFTAKKLTLNFEKSELDTKKFALSGAFEFPKPFDGAIDAEISKEGDNWKCALSTEKPVAIPTLGIVFHLGGENAIEKKDGLYSLTLNGSIASKDRFGQIDINNLVIKSDGSAKGIVKIGKNPTTKVNKGFGFEVKSLEFEFDPPNQKYELTMKGGISFENLGIKTIEGTVTVGSGSVFSIQIDSINIEKNPVTFRGKFTYNNNEFLAKVDVSIKNLGGGIKGMVVIGTQPIDETKSYSYWYGELEIRGEKGIPLGQTGLSLLALGGGVGSNYNPPIGSQKGSPINADGGIALKASVTIGDAPSSGKVFAGRLSMVLFPAAGYFSLNGKVWILDKEDAMFGEGQLNVRWDSPARLDGKLRLFVGVLDAKGRIAKFNSEVEFRYAGGKDWYIRSNDISGQVMDKLRYKGEFNIQPDKIWLKGTISFDLGGPVEGEGTEKDGDKPLTKKKDLLNIEAHLEAKTEVIYNKPPAANATREVGWKMFYASAEFKGYWDVSINIADLLTKTITSGDIQIGCVIDATETHLKFQAKANIVAEVPGIFSNWHFEFHDVNLGYETDI
jgi:chromosome segregation ATPase